MVAGPMWFCCLLLAQSLTADVPELIQSGKLDLARVRLHAALRKSPRAPALRNLLGVVEAQAGNYRAAEANFLEALGGSPEAVPVYANLGRLYQEHLETDEAALSKGIETYRKLLRFDPGSAEGLYQLAFLLMRKGEYRESLSFFEKLATALQQKPQALAVALADQAGLGANEEARRLARELTAHGQFNAADILGILPALERSQQYELARMLLEAGARTSGPNAPILLALARGAYWMKDYEGTLAYLAHARELEPKNAGVHFFFGMTAVALDLPLEAKRSLLEAVRLAPGNAYHQYAAGAVLAQDRDASQSIPYFENYCRLRPGDVRGRFALGVAQWLSSDYEAARRTLDPLVSHSPTATGAHYFLGRIARQENRLADAEREFMASLKIHQNQPDVHAELGAVYISQRKYAEAERELATALSLAPGHYQGNLNLLRLYQRTKDPRSDDQLKHVDAIKRQRGEREQALWRTVEIRPF